MELAAAQHHSRDVGPGKHDGLRAQKTASSGKRRGVLTEPEAQVGAVTVGYVAVPGPLLSAPMLADVQATLLQKKKEAEERSRVWKEEEARERAFQEINRRVMRGEPLTDAEDATWRHGLPPLPRSGARRLQRQWHCSTGFAGCDSPCAVFPWVDDWHLVLGITAGVDQKDSVAVVVLAVAFAGRFCWYCSSRCVSFPVVRPRMRCIKYGSELQSCRCLDGLLVTLHLALCVFSCRQAQDAMYHGRYGSEVQSCRCFGSRSTENCGFPAVAVLQHGRRHLLRGSEAHPMVLVAVTCTVF